MSAVVYDNAGTMVLGKRIINKNGRTGALKATGNTPLNTTFQAVKDRSTAEAQLQVLNAAYYTNARLATMSTNDLVYALRIGYDAANIR